MRSIEDGVRQPGKDAPERFYTGDELEGLEALEVRPPSRGSLHAMLLDDPISQLNAPMPIVLDAGDPVSKAAKFMARFRYGSILVEEDGLLAGIFTERDLLLRCTGKDLDRLHLREVMTRNPQILTEEDTLACAMNLMAAGGYRHIPIVRNGWPVGFISVRGILRYIAENALR